MLLHVRSIAVSVSVMCFFVLSFVCWLSGRTPFTCCRRAFIGALFAYVAATLAVKGINAVLTDAMIADRMNRRKEQDRGSGN